MQAYPLTRANRMRIAKAFATVPRVDISIECVIEDQMGEVSVDDVGNPRCFLMELDHFFAYLAGDFTNDNGHAFIQQIPRGRFLMAGSRGWADAIMSAFGDGVRPIKRWSFSSESLSVEHLQALADASPHWPNIQRIDAALATAGIPYLEIGAFESPQDFEDRGIGYCMNIDEQVIGIAYSSLVCSDAIEVSIFVDDKHHRQGIATVLGAHLLLWCLENHLSPHWDAANPESCGLAEKLGYTRVGEYTAYFLLPEDSTG